MESLLQFTFFMLLLVSMPNKLTAFKYEASSLHILYCSFMGNYRIQLYGQFENNKLYINGQFENNKLFSTFQLLNCLDAFLTNLSEK